MSVNAYDLEVVRQYYSQLLGPLNIYKAGDIERAYGNGLETSAIIDALQETAMAPRPSHYYFVAILRRYALEGITTREAAEAQRDQRRRERYERTRERWGNWYSDPNELPF